MAVRRHLARAPITEAVIDLRLQTEVPLNLVLCRSQLADLGYQDAEPLQAFQARITVEQGRALPPDTRSEQIGTQYRTPDGRQVVQLRKNGISFHRLEPYTSWEEIFPQAKVLWETYCDELPETAWFSRAAVRFVNRLQLPMPVANLSEYLEAPPSVPRALPQALRGFLTRVVIADHESGATALITQAVEPPAVDSAHLVVLLDIDTYMEGIFQPKDPMVDKALWTLREFKNRIFFESVTETATRLFE